MQRENEVRQPIGVGPRPSSRRRPRGKLADDPTHRTDHHRSRSRAFHGL